MKLRAQRLLLALITTAEASRTAARSAGAAYLAAVAVVAYGVSYWSIGAALVTGGGLLILDLKT